MGVDDGGIVAGVVFHNWSPAHRTIELSAAADTPKWMTRAIISGIMAYPFEELNCQMIFAQTAVDNTRVRRLWKRLGATEYIVARLHGENKDAAFLTLTREAWGASRFNNQHG